MSLTSTPTSLLKEEDNPYFYRFLLFISQLGRDQSDYSSFLMLH